MNFKNLGANTVKRLAPFFTCEECGRQVPAERTKRRFCSLQCTGLWASKHNVGDANPLKGRPTGRTPANKTEHVPLVCEICQTTFRVKPSHASRRRFCSMACRNKWQSWRVSGERGNLWNGGHEPYYGPTWRAARRAVRLRDKVCQRCGKTPEENGKALDVHHIVPFKQFGREQSEAAHELTNLVCLCVSCHLLTEHATERRGLIRLPSPR